MFFRAQYSCLVDGGVNLRRYANKNVGEKYRKLLHPPLMMMLTAVCVSDQLELESLSSCLRQTLPYIAKHIRQMRICLIFIFHLTKASIRCKVGHQVTPLVLVSNLVTTLP